MQTLRRSIVAAILATLALSATATAKPPATASAPPLPQATPESQGMSSERLARLHAEIERFVSDGKHAGVVSLIARNGRIVSWQTSGSATSRPASPWRRTRSAASTRCRRS